MAELIIGHTTHESAMLWVRGDKRLPHARITLKPQPVGDPIYSDPLPLRRDDDYTAVAPIAGLQPGTRYRAVAEFARSPRRLGRPGAVQCGQFQTFPGPASEGSGFSFLLGSCNLSTARLTSIGGLLMSGLGTWGMSRSISRPRDTWIWPKPTRGSNESFVRWSMKRVLWATVRVFPRLLRFAADRVAWIVWFAVMQVTRFQQPEPTLPSPFAPLLARLEEKDEPGEEKDEPAAFMLHAGDQIYFDIDAPTRPAEVEEYRRAYRQAWFEDDHAREFLTKCPHYMILDDHEIVDGFANQPWRSEHLEPARKAYREYVHSRQPQKSGAFHYRFRYNRTPFFVLDTRTQRDPDRGEMIDPDQLCELKRWLCKNRHELKFVVSSVPFVAQLRPWAEDDDVRGRTPERDDKWCGDAFRGQRDGIIDFIDEHDVQRLVFLAGDMHCTYHATMRVGDRKSRRAVHELAAGPINQVRFTERKRFYDLYRGKTGRDVPYSSLLRSFHGAAAAAMQVTVDPEPSLVLSWQVVPTSRRNGSALPVLRGQIGFPEIAR